jgi:hypothetical protein
MALEHGCKTIAFPNISTGVYGFPKDEAAIISVKAVAEFLSQHEGIKQVVFVCFDEENFGLVKGQLQDINIISCIGVGSSVSIVGTHGRACLQLKRTLGRTRNISSARKEEKRCE